MQLVLISIFLVSIFTSNLAFGAATVFFKDGSKEAGSSVWIEGNSVYMNKSNEIYEFSTDEVQMEETLKYNRIGKYADTTTPDSKVTSRQKLLTNQEKASKNLVDPASEYLRLLKATKYIENYKEAAAVSARVFNARGEGNDKEFARFMNIVATSNLSDVRACMADVYKTHDLTHKDVINLISIFESPLGVKILDQSKRMMIADIEQGNHQALPTNLFTDKERHEMEKMQQNASYRKYGLMTANREFAKGMMKCITESSAVKKAGIKF